MLPDWGPFVRVQTSNQVTLDYVRDDPPFTEQHCGCLVDDTAFDTGQSAGPAHPDLRGSVPARARRINHLYGGRGVHFDDPDGHLMELITTPTATPPED